MSYRGVQRAAQRAHIRRVEAEARRRDEAADPSTLSDSMLNGAIYRLQGRNRDGRYKERINTLLAEKQKRWAAS